MPALGFSRRTRFFLIVGMIVVVLFDPSLCRSGSPPSELFVFHDANAPHADLNSGVELRHLWFEDLARTPYSECWYYLFFGEDGTIFFCHLTLAHVASFIKQYSLDFNLIPPDGTTRFYGDSYKKGDAEWKTDRLLVRLGRNILEGDFQHQKLHIEELGYLIDLTFSQHVPPYRDGCGRMYLNRQKTSYLDITYQPSLNVSGTLRYQGETIPIKGWGYGDHVRQTFIPTDFAKVLYAFRIRMNDFFITCLEYFPNPDFHTKRVATMIVAYQDRILHVSHDYTFSPVGWYKDSQNNVQAPTSFQLKEDSLSFQIEGIANGDLLQRVDLLGAVKPFQKKILQLLGIHSYSYVSKERFSCKVLCPEVQGTFQGTGLLEVIESN